MEDHKEDTGPRTEEDIEIMVKKLKRMSTNMMFMELLPQFGRWAAYYDTHSLELLDEKMAVMKQMEEGVPFWAIPNGKDILEGLVKIGPDGHIIER